MCESALQMFKERLLRKAYRPGRRPSDCPADVYACEAAFGQLLTSAEETQPMDRGEWHARCNTFSDEWEHICHWVHPSRLADFLTEELELEWTGEYPARPAEEGKAKAKVKSNVKAQRFRCPECDVECNSYAQYTIHAQGSKHVEMVEAVKQSELAFGRVYESPGAVPLDTDGQPSSSPQAYFRRGESDPRTDAQPAATPEKKGESAKKARKRASMLTTYATFLAMSTVSMGMTPVPHQMGGEYYEPSQDAYGCWGSNCGRPPVYAQIESDFAAQSRSSDSKEMSDDEEEERRLRGDFSMNPNAEPFLGGRSYTLPTHDRWSDEEVSESSDAESSPGNTATTRSHVSSSEVDEEAARLTDMLRAYLAHGGDRARLVSELRVADAHAASTAVLSTAAKCDAAQVASLVGEAGCDELCDALGGDLTARMSAGPRVVEETDDMDACEAEHLEEANLKEAAAYTASLSLGMALCAAGTLASAVVSSMLAQYARNITSDEQVPPSAAGPALKVARDLAARIAAQDTPLDLLEVPEAADGTPRRLRGIIAALAA